MLTRGTECSSPRYNKDISKVGQSLSLLSSVVELLWETLLSNLLVLTYSPVLVGNSMLQ